ncbi:20801_t:CDS:2, partial [Cetraspora pellucida]
QSVENNDIRLIEFDNLNFSAKKHKKGRSCASLNDLKFTCHILTDYEDINIDEKEMKSIFSMGLEHENIIKAFISQSEKLSMYYLLVEVTNQGNLTDYLERNKLNWIQKINLASQLISELECLHNHQIVHSSLNPKNVLIHNHILKLTNFGSLTIFKPDGLENIPFIESRELMLGSRAIFKSDDLESISYLNPQELTLEKGFIKSYSNKDDNFSNRFKSNIYSLGVLLWQISSGIQPYMGLTTTKVIEYISNGEREKPVDGTLIKY